MSTLTLSSLARRAATVCLAITCCFTAMSQNITKPDFAFPDKVVSQSEERIRSARASGNAPAELRALLNLALATTVKNPDSLQSVINRIDRTALHLAATDTAAASMATLIEATFLYNYYQNNRWTLDRRQLPLTPLPASLAQWSGRQLQAEIMRLAHRALAAPEALRATPLRRYNALVTTGPDTYLYYPTVLDFTASRLAAIVRSFARENLPVSALCAPDSIASVAAGLDTSRPEAAAAMRFLTLRLDGRRPDSAPYAQAECERIDMVQSLIYPAFADEGRLKAISLLEALYADSPATEAAAPALLALGRRIGSGAPIGRQQTFASQLRATIKADRTPALRPDLTNLLRELTQPSVTFTAPDVVEPGSTMEVAIKARNASTVELRLYKVTVTDYSDSYYNTRRLPGTLTGSAKAMLPGGTSPREAADTVRLTVPAQGFYVIVPVIDGVAEQRSSHRIIRATGLALGAVTFTDHAVLVVDRMSGAPVSDAEIFYMPSGRNARYKKVASTGADGLAKVKPDGYMSLHARKGADIFAPALGLWTGRRELDNRYPVSAFTDLALYHPGDTVQWVALLGKVTPTGRTAPDGISLRAVLHDANGEKVDTLVAATDAFGRASGSFRLPDGGLTGTFGISITADSGDDSWHGWVDFTVSDYKLPTFMVEVTDAVRNTPAQGAVTLRGRAVTFAGMPVAGAKATLDLGALSHFWRAGHPDMFYTADTITGADGSFEFTVSAATLGLAPMPGGFFAADVAVTDAALESHTGRLAFSLGKSYVITANPPADIDASAPASLRVAVTGPDGRDTTATVGYSFVRPDGSEAASGSLTTPGAGLRLDAVPSGVYTLRLTLAGADTLECDDIAVYRPDDALPPRPAPVWVPSARAEAGADILIGTTAPLTHVLAINATGTQITLRRWLSLPAGMHRIKAECPAGAEGATLSLTATYAGKSCTRIVEITNPAATESIKITTSTFRDGLRPGSTEQWAVTVSAADGSPATAAVILDVYNRALDELARARLSLSTPRMPALGLDVRTPDTGTLYSDGYQLPFSYLNTRGMPDPALQTYGMTPGSYARRFMMARSSGIAVTNEMKEAVEEEVSADAMPMAATQMKMADSAAPMLAESAVEEVPADAGAATAPDDARQPGEPKFEYRKGEVPLALFRPDLTTDSAGRLQLTFTVPDANATWNFNILAITRALLAADSHFSAVAAKEIMVTPNLPRFVRTGDEIRIDATVFNNSPRSRSVLAEIELFDPATGAVTATETATLTIGAQLSAVASITLKAPARGPFAGYRIKASSEGSADGEQALIAVLPSSQPVIESTPFYLPADTATALVGLPPHGSDASLTLTYTANPLWYVVTSLPGLSTPRMATSPWAAAAIYANAVSSGLVESNPLLAKAIAEWQGGADPDSMLTPMLERNPDLKTLMLEATPWVWAAQSEAEQLAGLSRILDRKACRRQLEQSVDLLAKLQKTDGGWAWGEYSATSSEWATAQVLDLLGMLGRLGYMPDSGRLAEMTDRALGYMQSVTVRHASQVPDPDLTSWARMLAMWPGFKPSATGRSLADRGLQQLLASWKGYGITAKAEAAMVLHASGYKTVAREVLESVREYAVSTPDRGMWWPSVTDRLGRGAGLTAASAVLEALCMVSPGSPDIDRVRQWLIYEKQALDWGNTAGTARVVNAVLASSGRWIEPAGRVSFAVGGKPIAVTGGGAFAGCVRADLSDTPSEATLSVSRTATPPAWGAVVRQAVEPMRSIAAASSPAVSIAKRTLLRRGADWVEADTLPAGAHVRIELTITASQAMDYVAVTDCRAACLEPADQLPEPVWADGLCFYRENRDAETRLFIDRLPRGTYILTYDMWVNNSGSFASGIATLQSQYAPELTAHSAGTTLLAE